MFTKKENVSLLILAIAFLSLKTKEKTKYISREILRIQRIPTLSFSGF